MSIPGPFSVRGTNIFASNGEYVLHAPHAPPNIERGALPHPVVVAICGCRNVEQRVIDLDWICNALNEAWSRNNG